MTGEVADKRADYDRPSTSVSLRVDLVKMLRIISAHTDETICDIVDRRIRKWVVAEHAKYVPPGRDLGGEG